MTKQETGSIQVVDRLTALLEAIARNRDPVSLKVLAAETELHPSTAFRILAAATENGLVAREGSNYRLGIRLLQLGSRVASHRDLSREARPLIEALRDQIGETVNLTVRQGDEVVYLDRALPERMMRVEQRIGSRARGGNWVDVLLSASSYSAPLARLGKIRSAGITDLRFGNLLDEDWNKRSRFAPGDDRRKAVPLPESVACYTIAGTTGRKAGDLSDRLVGDGIVPLASALGQHGTPRLALAFDASRQWVAHRTGHFDLLRRPEVCAQIRRWLSAPG